jgi:hypothetical protein
MVERHKFHELRNMDTLMATVEDCLRILKAYRFPLASEIPLQDAIEKKFMEFGIPYKREHILGPKDRVDFMVGGIAIEVKIKSSPTALYRQIKRYAEHDEVLRLVLVSNVVTMFPPAINGKPVFVVNLAKAWM